jgi:hypothetical protein
MERILLSEHVYLVHSFDIEASPVHVPGIAHILFY